MTTATRTRKGDALSELQAREQAHADAKATASDLGSEWGVRSRQLQELQDQRRRLVFHQPELVDHAGQPNPDVKDNPVAAIDAQVAELGDVPDLHARMLHARQLEQSTAQARADFAAAHLDELLEALAPDADAAVDEVVRCMDAFAVAARTYLGLARRVDGLKATDRTRQRLRVVAIDTASDLVNMADNYTRPPSPTELR